MYDARSQEICQIQVALCPGQFHIRNFSRDLEGSLAPVHRVTSGMKLLRDNIKRTRNVLFMDRSEPILLT